MKFLRKIEKFEILRYCKKIKLKLQMSENLNCNEKQICNKSKLFNKTLHSQ